MGWEMGCLSVSCATVYYYDYARVCVGVGVWVWVYVTLLQRNIHRYYTVSVIRFFRCLVYYVQVG